MSTPPKRFLFLILGVISGIAFHRFGFVMGGVLAFFAAQSLWECPASTLYILAVFDLFGYAALSLPQIKLKQKIYEARLYNLEV